MLQKAQWWTNDSVLSPAGTKRAAAENRSCQFCFWSFLLIESNSDGRSKLGHWYDTAVESKTVPTLPVWASGGLFHTCYVIVSIHLPNISSQSSQKPPRAAGAHYRKVSCIDLLLYKMKNFGSCFRDINADTTIFLFLWHLNHLLCLLKKAWLNLFHLC